MDKKQTILGLVPVVAAATVLGATYAASKPYRASSTLRVSAQPGVRVDSASIDGIRVAVPSREPLRPDLYQMTAEVNGQRQRIWVRVPEGGETSLVLGEREIAVHPSERLMGRAAPVAIGSAPHVRQKVGKMQAQATE
jgi:hypothetical protein